MNIIIFIIISCFCLYLINFLIKKYISITYVKNFDSYTAVLTYHMEKAYTMIHKDRVLIFSMEAVKPNEDEITKASKDFAKLVLKFIGPRLEKDLIYLYGDKETLIFNLIEYFTTKFESDEIRDNAMNVITGNENLNLSSLMKKGA